MGGLCRDRQGLETAKLKAGCWNCIHELDGDLGAICMCTFWCALRRIVNLGHVFHFDSLLLLPALSNYSKQDVVR